MTAVRISAAATTLEAVRAFPLLTVGIAIFLAVVFTPTRRR